MKVVKYWELKDFEEAMSQHPAGAVHSIFPWGAAIVVVYNDEYVKLKPPLVSGLNLGQLVIGDKSIVTRHTRSKDKEGKDFIQSEVIESPSPNDSCVVEEITKPSLVRKRLTLQDVEAGTVTE